LSPLGSCTNCIRQGREIIVLPKISTFFTNFCTKFIFFTLHSTTACHSQGNLVDHPNALYCNAVQNSRKFIQYFGNLLSPTTISIAIQWSCIVVVWPLINILVIQFEESSRHTVCISSLTAGCRYIITFGLAYGAGQPLSLAHSIT
jgi:hypothetical protein